jgi:predicted dehydrogenase
VTVIRTLSIGFAVAWALAGASFAAPPEIPNPKSFPVWHLSADAGSSIVIGMKVHEIDGFIAISGAVWPEDKRHARIASQNHEFYEGTIKVDGKIVPADLSIFPFYDTRDDAKTFSCSVSNLPWEGPDTGDSGFSLRLPRNTGSN